MSVKVKFISEVEVKDGKKILKAAKNANVKINTSCEGKGKCGKCVIKVINGKLSEPTKQELKVLGQEKIDKGYRLSCQTQILEDSVIEIINYNEIKVKEENIDNKVEIKDNNKAKVKEENIDNKVETKDNDKIKVKEEDIYNKVEIKDNNKIIVKKDNVDNKIKSREDNKVLVKKNRKSAT